jgi:hypothetical protein
MRHADGGDSGRRTGNRGQGSEDRGQRTWDRGQRTEDRGRGSGLRKSRSLTAFGMTRCKGGVSAARKVSGRWPVNKTNWRDSRVGPEVYSKMRLFF